VIDAITGRPIIKNGACDACHARTWVKEIYGKEGGEVCNKSKIRSLPAMCPLRKRLETQETTRLLADLDHRLRVNKER